MNRSAFARRYWSTLTGATASPESSAAGRGRAGFKFWQRYWASFTASDIPVPDNQMAAESATHVPEPVRATHRLPTVRQKETGWFPLPSLSLPASLRAGDEEDVVTEVATPDGQTEFFVWRSGVVPTQCRIEVVLRDFDRLPAVVSIRYGTAKGEQLLVVPLVTQLIGPPAAQVVLPGFDGRAPWEASAPVPVDATTLWEKDIVVTSIKAAANEATRDAWRQVASLVAGELRLVIDQALW
jgi:hypothetical protein